MMNKASNLIFAANQAKVIADIPIIPTRHRRYFQGLRVAKKGAIMLLNISVNCYGLNRLGIKKADYLMIVGFFSIQGDY